MAHFLQSDAWAAFQAALGRTVISTSGTTEVTEDAQKSSWSYTAYLEKGTLNTRLYTPYGPTFTSEAALQDALTSLVAKGRDQGVTFIRIEPTQAISRETKTLFHVKSASYQHLQPQATQIIDLTQPKESLVASMSQNTRNIVRNYTKKGITVTASHNPDDIQHLLHLLAKVAARTGLHAHSDDYLRTQAKVLIEQGSATIYLAHHTDSDTPVAAALFFDDATTRYYAHAAADDDYRKLQLGTALLGQAILDAQEEGKQAVDLYGITLSEDKNHPWAGFTRFKKSFGGEARQYGGTWDIPLKPLQYRIYRTYQTLRQKLRK